MHVSYKPFFVLLASTFVAGCLSPVDPEDVVIDPSDPDPAVIVSVVGGNSISEGDFNGRLPFNITLSEISTVPIDVTIETRDGSATSELDYIAQSTVVTIPNGSLEVDVAIALIGDVLDEGNETVQLAITAISAGEIGASSAIGTIVDDDNPAFISVAGANGIEGDVGQSTLSFAVSLSTPSGQNVSVDYSTVSVTATAGVDYVAASGQVFIPAGSVSETINVQINGDTIDEIDETFNVVLSNASNAVFGSASANGRIINDDTGAPPVVMASIGAPTPVVEGSGSSLVYPVSLSEANATDIDVQYQTNSGSAIADIDFVSAAASITILAGELSGSISVDVIDDDINEADETVVVDLISVSSGVISTGSASGVINDDDAAPTISIADGSIVEGDAGDELLPFVVSISELSGVNVSVSYQTADVTATAGEDYVTAAGTVTVFAGSLSAIVDVAVSGDTLDEPDETFSMTLSNPVNATIADGNATGSIADNDEVPTISIDDVSIAEGDNGQSNLVFTISLSIPAAQDVTFDVASADGTATAGADYVALTSSETITAGNLSTPVTVSVVGDTVTEPDETLAVTLTNVVNATVADGDGVGTILDDEDASIISIADSSIVEGDAGQADLVFTVSLSNAAAQDVTFDLATADGSASAGSDYLSVSTNGTIVAGSLTATTAVPVLGDTLAEGDESFSATLSNVANATVADEVGFGTIVDDDVAPILTISDASMAEGDSGQSDLIFTVSLDSTYAEDVTFDVASANGTATAGADYVAVSTNTSVLAGSLTTAVAIPVLGDTILEPDETLTVTISNPVNATIADALGNGIILNDDSSSLLSITDTTIVEGDAGQSDMVFTISLDAVNAQDVTFDVTTSDGTASASSDYVALADSATIIAGNLTTTAIVPVLGDVDVEANETFTVSLTNPVNATIADGLGLGTILDDDSVPTISIADASIAEGDSGQTDLVFTISLDTAGSQDVSFDLATSDGTASAGSDYVALSTNATIPAGDVMATASVQVLGDITEEPDENLSLTLSNVSNATVADDVGQGTILNDDSTSMLSIADASLVEGNSGQADMVFTISIDNTVSQDVTFDVISADGSATSGSDYVAVNTSASILAGSLTTTFPVTVNGDTDEESDESFTLALSNAANAVIADGNATGTITDDDTADVSGLASRPPNASCIAPDRPMVNTSIGSQNAFPSLPFLDKPLGMVQAPGDSSEWYVIEKAGRVLRFNNSPSASGFSTFIDIREPSDPIDVDSSGNESGLLGIAFHPDYGNGNWYVYLSYTIDGSSVGASYLSVVSRFESKDNGQTLDATDAVTLLTLEQPFFNHNGGQITFGPDGMLYIGFGDGSGPVPNPAIDTQSLLGAMLRIDVDSAAPYGIPADNPFAGNPLCSDGSGAAACPEIYAWGFRNPWKWSFDDVTGTLWLGDVGENSWEEIDQVENGGNYGWFCREGSHDFNPSSNCPTNLIDPVIEYPHSVGRSVTGGYVYRGTAIPELAGRYVFGDYIEGKLFASVDEGNGNLDYEEILDTSMFIAAFAQEANGELLFLNYFGGNVQRIVQSGGNGNDTIPTLLSETGCVDPANPTQPANGLIPYDINSPFWSDNAVKERWYAIPDSASIDVAADGDWLFPAGSVLVKNFRLNGSLIETRLFMRHPDGIWGGYTYEWNDSETDATRVIGGKTKTIGGQDWIYPNGTQCLQCHTDVAGNSLGLEHGQLNKRPDLSEYRDYGKSTLHCRCCRPADEPSTRATVDVAEIPGSNGYK